MNTERNKIARDIAKAALEELVRLPDMNSIMLSRTSLSELAESYIEIYDFHRKIFDTVASDSLASDGWEMIESAMRDDKL